MNLDVLAWFAAVKLAIAVGINPMGVIVAALFLPQQQPVNPLEKPPVVAEANE